MLIYLFGDCCSEFPSSCGHSLETSILIAIGQVVETMRQMDVKDTSLGKMLTGLEVILKRLRMGTACKQESCAGRKPTKNQSPCCSVEKARATELVNSS